MQQETTTISFLRIYRNSQIINQILLWRVVIAYALKEFKKKVPTTRANYNDIRDTRISENVTTQSHLTKISFTTCHSCGLANVYLQPLIWVSVALGMLRTCTGIVCRRVKDGGKRGRERKGVSLNLQVPSLLTWRTVSEEHSTRLLLTHCLFFYLTHHLWLR